MKETLVVLHVTLVRVMGAGVVVIMCAEKVYN